MPKNAEKPINDTNTPKKARTDNSATKKVNPSKSHTAAKAVDSSKSSAAVKAAPTAKAARQKKKTGMSRSSMILIIVLITISIITVAAAISFIVNTSGTPSVVLYSYTCEAGDSVSPSVFLVSSEDKEHTAEFAADVDIEELTHTVGTHTISVIIDGIPYKVSLTVKDTKAPSGKAHNLICPVGYSIKAAEMVTDIVDETKVSVTFKNPPDFSLEGRQSVRIQLTDEGGNITYIDGCYLFFASKINVSSWEMGTALPSPSDLCYISKGSGMENVDVVYQDVNSITEIKKPGEYSIPLRITVAGQSDTYYVSLTFKDTTPPDVTAKEGNVYDISTAFPPASHWIASCNDATEVKYSYAQNYSISEPDVYYIDILATDIAGNITPITVKITALDGRSDNYAPIISLKNDTEVITLKVGSQLALEDYVTIYDDKDGDIPVNDNERVVIQYPSDMNLFLPGDYTIVITATDSSNKSSSRPVTVRIVHNDISEKDAMKLADEIIASIIVDNMTAEQKILAVFDKISKNEMMDFTGKSDKSNEKWREFYYGFTLNRGDSYTTACMMSVLLERMNIDSIIIHNLSSTTYWTLVDYGDGWYHADPFLHDVSFIVDGSHKDTLKLTDAQMLLFNELNNGAHPGSNSYLFNNSIYPSTPILTEETGEYVYLPYRVIYLCTDGGYIEGETDQKVSHRQSASTVTAIPRAGYRFVCWSDGVTTAERNDIIASNLTVTATFEKSGGLYKTYILNYSAGVGGTVKGEAFQTVYAGYYGSEVVAVPDDGYKFVGWSDGIMTPARKDIAKRDTSICANFAPLSGDIYTIEYRATPGGSIDGESFQVLDLGKDGTEVTAIADEGYVFNMWSDGVLSATRKDPYGADLTVTARFVKADSELFELKYTVPEGGTIEGLTYQRIESGSYGDTVKAVASRGYYFVSWSDGFAEAERRDLPTESKEITALFAKLKEYRVLYMVSGKGGYIDGDSTQYIYEGETTASVTAVPLYGFVFKGWSDGFEGATRSDTPSDSIELTAIFEELPKFTVKYIASVGGSIEGIAEQVIYINTTTSAVKAIAEAGDKFVSWSDGGTTEERTDTASSEDIEVTAVFEKLKIYTANYSSSEHGSVSGELVQTAYEGESFKTVIAIAEEGYEFAEWSDGVTTPERTDNALSDINATAIFVPKMICTVYYSFGTGGTVQGKRTQNVLIGNSTEEVTAVADEGYVFIGWSDGVKSATRSDIATQNNVFYLAMFELIETQ